MKFIATVYVDQSMVEKFEAFKAAFNADKDVTTLDFHADDFRDLLGKVIAHVHALETPTFGNELDLSLELNNEWGRTLLSVTKTSSNNIFVEGFIDVDTGDLDDVVYTVAYEGTRHRFQMEADMSMFNVPQLFDDSDDWDEYETSGDNNMLPWEVELDYIARIADEFRASQDAGNPNGELYAKIRKRASVAFIAMTNHGVTSNQTHAGVIQAWDRLQVAEERLQPMIDMINGIRKVVRHNVF